MNLQALLHTVVGQCGSDIHFKAANPPVIRYDGELVRLDYSPLTRKDINEVINEILSDEEVRIFEERGEMDVSYAVSELSRFRVNISREMGNVSSTPTADPVPTATTKAWRLTALKLVEVIRFFPAISLGRSLTRRASATGRLARLRSSSDLARSTFRRIFHTISSP